MKALHSSAIPLSCYADDLIQSFIDLVATDAGVTAPINIGNPGEFTIRQLAELVLALTGSHSRFVHRPLSSEDPRQRRSKIEKAKIDARMGTHRAIAEGLTRTIDYVRTIM